MRRRMRGPQKTHALAEISRKCARLHRAPRFFGHGGWHGSRLQVCRGAVGGAAPLTGFAVAQLRDAAGLSGLQGTEVVHYKITHSYLQGQSSGCQIINVSFALPRFRQILIVRVVPNKPKSAVWAEASLLLSCIRYFKIEVSTLARVWWSCPARIRQKQSWIAWGVGSSCLVVLIGG